MSGADELRQIVRAMNDTRESAMDGYSAPEIVRMFQCMQRSGWDFYPDQWTKGQRDAAALLGHVPKFDDDGRPLVLPSETVTDEPDDGCTDPGGHKWQEGEPDRAGEGPMRCIHCGADGDA